MTAKDDKMPTSEELITRQIRIWLNAYEALEDLRWQMATEKGMPNITLTEAVSLAILEAAQRRGLIAVAPEVAAE